MRLKQRVCVWAWACVWPEGEAPVCRWTRVSVQSTREWAPACEPVCARAQASVAGEARRGPARERGKESNAITSPPPGAAPGPGPRRVPWSPGQRGRLSLLPQPRQQRDSMNR